MFSRALPFRSTQHVLRRSFAYGKQHFKRRFKDSYGREIDMNEVMGNKDYWTEDECVNNIHLLCTAKRLDDAERIFYTMVEDNRVEKPSIRACTALLAGIAQFSDEERFRKLLSAMEQLKIGRDDIFLTQAIEFYSNAGNVSGALHIFNHIKNPDARAYTAIMRVLAKKGMTRELIELVEQMDKHTKESPIICSLLAISFAHNKNMEAIQELMIDMKKKRIPLDIVFFNGIFSTLKKHRLAVPLDNIIKAVQISNLSFTRTTYNSLMGALSISKEDNSTKIKMLFIDMLEKGFTPNLETFKALIAGYARHGIVILS